MKEIKEQIRQKIESILWREYDPHRAPNFEEVSEEILDIVLSTYKKSLEKGVSEIERDALAVGLEPQSRSMIERFLSLIKSDEYRNNL